MEKPPEEQKRNDDDFNQINDVLAVPEINKPLPDNRKWILPLPDPKALEDYPLKLEGLDGNFGNQQTQPEKGKTDASYTKDSSKSSGRS